MGRRKLEDKNTRKLLRLGKSLGATFPIGFLRKLKWRKGQKITIKLKGKKLIVEDWKK